MLKRFSNPWIKYPLMVFLGLVVLVGVVLFSLYTAVNIKPKYYKTALLVPQEDLVVFGKQAVRKTEDSFKKITPYKPTWETVLTEDEINGFLSEELKKGGSSILPKEICDPRISLNNGKIDFACKIETGLVSGVLNMNLAIRFPEENRCEITFLETHLGVVPFSKEAFCDLLADGLRKSGATVVINKEGLNPVLSISFQIGYEKNYELLFHELKIDGKTLIMSGLARKKTR